MILQKKKYKRYINIYKNNSKPLKPQNTDIPNKLEFLNTDIKAVLFDVYGTLFISASGDISLADKKNTEIYITQALENSGYAINSSNKNIKIFDIYTDLIKQEQLSLVNKGIMHPEVDIIHIWKKLCSILFENKIINKLPGQNELKEISIQYESLANPAWPMPNAFKILSYLKNKNIKLGIVSNAQFYTKIMIESFFNTELEDIGFCSNLLSFSYEYNKSKPDSSLFSKPIHNLNTKYRINNNEILFIGNDILNDIMPAQKLGLNTALFSGDKRSLRLREDNLLCNTTIPDLIINDLILLRNII